MSSMALFMSSMCPRLKALLNELGCAHTRRLYYAITAVHSLCVVTSSLRIVGLKLKASLKPIDTV